MTYVDTPDASLLATEEMIKCLAAAAEIRECYRVLDKGGLNIVGEVLRGQGEFFEMDHYPKDDVYDRDHASQYYYHAHRDDHDEHGHFHLFLRSGAMIEGMVPALGPSGDDRVAHVIAIAMDAWGLPSELFSVNRWVTDESWFSADQVIPLLDHFAIDHAAPSWPVNRWITAMVQCFRPHLIALLRHRDEVIASRNDRVLTAVLEDRSLEVTGSLAVDLDGWEQRLKEQQASLRQTTAGTEQWSSFPVTG